MRLPAQSLVKMLVAVLGSVALVLSAAPAQAGVAHSTVVSEDPVPWTPHVLDGTVYAITVVGDTVVVGGTFSEVADSARRQRYARQFLFAFHRRTGQVSPFRVELDGPVYALAPGPDGTVLAGGDFRRVNGDIQRGVTRLRIDTGERVAGFRASVNWGTVWSLASRGNHLYVGGSFTAINGVSRAGLARVHAGTGALDTGFDARLTANNGERVSVRAMALAPAGDRLVAIGNFSHSDGLRRGQLVMVDTRNGRPANWYTDAYERRCNPIFITYLRGVAYSPDGTYFVVVTTGGRSHPDELCDTAARFEATGTGMHRPTWVNHTGGNSLYSVEITGAAVYVGGHQRWQDNPHGYKFPGPGAVEREGIAALHPRHGRALSWNPGRARGVGVQALLATEEGLYVGSDTTRLGGVYRGRIGMFPR